MTFEAQESALLSLLFDPELREAFARDRDQALAPFDLSATERADFHAIRLGGLETDAKLRRDLVLARLCRSLPLSFSISSALDPSLARVERLLSSRFFLVPSAQRTLRYAEELRRVSLALPGLSERAHGLAAVLFELERGMAGLSAAAREAARDGQLKPEEAPLSLSFGWERLQLTLAPFTGLFLLPRAHHQLMHELCPCPLDQLWARLKRAPLPRARLEQALREEQPRLLVVRAQLDASTPCDATISQRTVELSQGFAPLLRKLAEGESAQRVLEAMHRTGAKPSLLEGIAAGLLRLLEEGMLRPTRPRA